MSKVQFLTSLFSNDISLITLPNLSKWNIKENANTCNATIECMSLLSSPDISQKNST